MTKTTKPKPKASEPNITKQVLAEQKERQFQALSDYSFRRLKHPSENIDFITVDSLRKALINYDITDISDRVVLLMMEMAKEVSKGHEKQLLQQMKE